MSELRAAIASVPGLEYLGSLALDDVNQLLAGAHLLVNTSTHEGFSNTFIQAWLRAVPVVSLNADPDDLLESAGLGACPHGDWVGFVSAVRKGILDKGWRAAAGARAREYATQMHSTMNIERLVSLLDRPVKPPAQIERAL
jgi:glycosyltransferase involved in cell wall biosynthesis